MPGNAATAADSSIGRTCSSSAPATSSGSCRCADPELESALELANMASVVATGIGRPSGLVRTSSCSIDTKRRMASAYGPSTRRVVSDATVICENHESIQSGPAAESAWPFERDERFAVTLSSAGSTPVASSAANVRTRCRKPISLVGDHFSRPSAMYGPRLE